MSHETDRWEKDLLKKGLVHDACMGMLLDAGTKEAASGNVAEGGQQIVTADTAATMMVHFLNDHFDKFPLLDYQDQQSMCCPEPTTGRGVVHDTNANSSGNNDYDREEVARRPSKRTRIENGGGGNKRQFLWREMACRM